MYKKVSIIIPAFNEEKTINALLKKVYNIRLLKNIQKEIIVVDDGSNDQTRNILRNQALNKNLRLFLHNTNQGKGAAIKTGLKHANGDIIVIQDADLEYNPQDINKCIEPIVKEKAKVVYGSRELGKKNKNSDLLFFLGGKLVTLICNLLYGSNLTDEPTCYKCFDKKFLNSFKMESNGFEWEPEITAKILKSGQEIKEVPINYYPRNKKDKKINYLDGIKAIWMLIKYRFKK